MPMHTPWAQSETCQCQWVADGMTDGNRVAIQRCIKGCVGDLGNKMCAQYISQTDWGGRFVCWCVLNGFERVAERWGLQQWCRHASLSVGGTRKRERGERGPGCTRNHAAVHHSVENNAKSKHNTMSRTTGRFEMGLIAQYRS